MLPRRNAACPFRFLLPVSICRCVGYPSSCARPTRQVAEFQALPPEPGVVHGPASASADLIVEIPHGGEVNHLIGARGASINALQQAHARVRPSAVGSARTRTHTAVGSVVSLSCRRVLMRPAS